jgi:hypothetical protein
MRFLRRFLNARAEARRVEDWKRAWSDAATHPDAARIAELRTRLDQLSAPDGDLEIEREMLDGLERVVEFAATVAQQGLPVLTTGHRVVGTDTCHFTAPVSMPDDAAQPSGRLLLTNVRAIFVGGARGVTVAWHAVARPLHTDRDLVLVRADGTVHRFRCNSFDDALCAAFVARRLAGRSPGAAKEQVR